MPNVSASPVKLQPPGAGLPLYELITARMIARLVWPLVSQTTALTQFKGEAEKILTLVRTIPTEQGSVSVLIGRFTGIEDSSRYWSVFMVLDHLRIVDEGIAQIIETLHNNRPYAREVRIQEVKPCVDAGPETVEAFIKAAASFEATIQQLGALKQQLCHSHPWFGLLNAHGWLCLAGFHHRIHRQQIERIKKIMNTQ